jgi:hypothetical protein
MPRKYDAVICSYYTIFLYAGRRIIWQTPRESRARRGVESNRMGDTSVDEMYVR